MAASLSTDPVRVTMDADKADVWATGVSLVTCVLGSYPWACAKASDPVFEAWLEAWDRMLVASAARQSATPGPSVPVVASTCCTGATSPAPVASARFGRFSRRSATVSPLSAPEVPVVDVEAPLCGGLAGSGRLCRDAVSVLGQLLVSRCGHGPVTAALSPLLLDLLVRMLDPRPHMRLTMAEVAAHPWLSQQEAASPSASSLRRPMGVVPSPSTGSLPQAGASRAAGAKAGPAAAAAVAGGSSGRRTLPSLQPSGASRASLREAW
jgi:serine/threonine protein kinase